MSINPKHKFDVARLKIEWAKQHINNLNACVNSFVNTSYYSIGTEKDAEFGCNNLKISFTKPIRREFSLIIGDVLHNMRGALDFITSGIVRERLKIPEPRHTNFPIAETRDKLKGIGNCRQIEEASPEILDFIVNDIQPYKTGNHEALFVLHEFNIRDKHRLIIPVMGKTIVDGIRAHDDTGHEFIGIGFIAGQHFEGTATSTIAPIQTFGGNLHVEDYGKPSFTILFDKGLPETVSSFEGNPIIPTLFELAGAVENAISMIENKCSHLGI